jgi:hypothetical protein
MAGGRPRKFSSPEELDGLIEEFFAQCREDSITPTITGLALALDTTRSTLLNYQREYGPEFLNSLKRAKAMVEFAIEQHLLNSKNQAGAIFNLKNNFGWRDEKAIEHSGELGVRSVSITGIKSKDA